MRLIHIVLATLLTTAPYTASAKMSDLHCDDSTRMTEMLADQFGAQRKAFGLRDPETVMEIWVQPRTHEWTLVQNYTNGTSCIVAMGEHWEDTLTGPA